VARPARVLRGRGPPEWPGAAGDGAGGGRGQAWALEAGDGRRRGASAGWRRGRAGVRAAGGSAAGFYLA